MLEAVARMSPCSAVATPSPRIHHHMYLSSLSIEACSLTCTADFSYQSTPTTTLIMSLFSQSGVSLNHMEKLSSNTIDQTCQKALELLDHPDWKEGKTFTEEGIYKVVTAKLHPVGAEKLPWHKRTSIHPVDRDLSYEEFRNGLLLVGGSSSISLTCSYIANSRLQDHTVNEQQYIPDLKHQSKIKTFREELPEVEVYLIQVCIDTHTSTSPCADSISVYSTKHPLAHQTENSLLL